jgi:hypothetical protein
MSLQKELEELQLKGEEYFTQMSFRDNIEKCFFIYNGLDRLNQKLPHNKDNVVPCCSECNYMKRDMSKDVFVDKIKEIHEWITKKS